VPTDATAVSATIISIDQSGSGALRATAVEWPLPATPILVFHRASVSTSAILPIGFAIGDPNVIMRAYGASTQVLVDVTGYYLEQIHLAVEANGTLGAGTDRAVGASHIPGTGVYTLTFDAYLGGCGVLATDIDDINVFASALPDGDTVTVDTYGMLNSTLKSGDFAFQLYISC
jgi:hypothetical protein